MRHRRGQISGLTRLRQHHDDDRQISQRLEDVARGRSEPTIASEQSPEAPARRRLGQLSVRQFPPTPCRCRLGEDAVAIKESGQSGGEIDIKQPHRCDR